MHSTQMASLLRRWFRTTYSTLPLLSAFLLILCHPSSCIPAAQGLSEPKSSPEHTCSSNSTFPTPLCLCALSLIWGSTKGRKELCPHLALTSSLCYSCEQGCSCVSAVKVALCCGYISTRNRAEAARSLTERTEELLDAKGFQLVEAWIRYRLETSRYMAPISHYQFP